MSYARPSPTADVVSWDTASVYTRAGQTSNIQWVSDGTPGAVLSLQAGYLGDATARLTQLADPLGSVAQLPGIDLSYDQFSAATSLQPTVFADPYGYTHFNAEGIFDTEFGQAYYAFPQSAVATSIFGVRTGTPMALVAYVPGVDNTSCAASPLHPIQIPEPTTAGISTHHVDSLLTTAFGTSTLRLTNQASSLQAAAFGDPLVVVTVRPPSLRTIVFGASVSMRTVHAQSLAPVRISTPAAVITGAQVVSSLIAGNIGPPGISTTKRYALDGLAAGQFGSPFAFSYLKAVPLLNPTAIGKPLVARSSRC